MLMKTCHVQNEKNQIASATYFAYYFLSPVGYTLAFIFTLVCHLKSSLLVSHTAYVVMAQIKGAYLDVSIDL